MASIKEKLKLAELIVERIKKDFEEVHLSGNLASTINVRVVGNNVEIEIPASMYDVQKYLEEGVFIFTGEGSYASEVDTYGGFSGKHTGFFERSVEQGTKDYYKLEGKEVRVNKV